MDSHEHLVDFFIAILLIFLFPLLYFGLKQDSIIQTFVSVETEDLVNEIRGKGFLTKEMYESFTEELSKTNMLYNISIEHQQHIHEPEYRFRTPEEVIEEQDSSYTGGNYYTYRPVSTEIPHVDDPISGTLNTETNESILAGATNTPASPSHIHTDDCYHGVKHIHTGSNISGGGCYGTSDTESVLCGYFISDTWYHYSGWCNTTQGGCGRIADGSSNYSLSSVSCTGCGRTVSVSITRVETTYTCSSCRASGSGSGTHYRQVAVYLLNCGKAEDHYYNGEAEAIPICNQIILSISPTHPTQTVAINDPLITTVIATFQDGSTKTVVAATAFSGGAVTQNQRVELIYSYILDGTTYSISCDINVTVIPRSKTCVNDHTYNLKSDGSDPGCPYCRSYVRTLSVTFPMSDSITIYKGSTLSDNGVTLLATYYDGHTELLHKEYVDNLDTKYVGTQYVTVSYKGKYLTLKVITKRSLTLCPVCNRYYELYPDDSSPGCPFCMSKAPIFTGKVMDYTIENHTREILTELFEGNGAFYFSEDDYVTVKVSSIKQSWGMRVLSYFSKTYGEKGIYAISGGSIRESGK